MRILVLLLASSLLSCVAFAQLPSFHSATSPSSLSSASTAAIGKEFRAFQRVTFNEVELQSFLANEDGATSFKLGLGQQEWIVDVEPFDPRSEDYILRIQTEHGIQTRPRGDNMTYRGFTRGPKPQEVCFTITDGFVYGLIAEEGDALFFQSLWLTDPTADDSDLILFRGSDGILPDDHMCGSTETSSPADDSHATEVETASRAQVTCYEVELAIASDFSMYQAYSSDVATLEARNVAVMALVNTDYAGQFADDYFFAVVEQFVSTCSTCDPWTSSTDAEDFLEDFTLWGGGGFSSNHDLGQLWTRRNFDGPTVGVAWVGTVCSFSRYHVLQDFTPNADFTRVLVTHEIGHNFNCLHDDPGTPFIMAPSVQNTTTWSNFSIGRVNAFGPSRNCLSASATCGSSPPPVADFFSSTTEICQNQQVSFIDQSIDAESWSWSFPGATPSTSTEQNPVVTYITPGVFDVTLTVTNTSGSDTETRSNYILVDPLPFVDFEATIVAPLEVSFRNFSSNAAGYSWSFGDGNFSSEFEPTHTYASSGIYNIVLTAFNICGQVSSELFLDVIIPPTPSFTSTNQTGCAPHSVSFTSTSTGLIDRYDWSFPGGSPSRSTTANPTVSYANPGLYDVQLTVSNSSGTNSLTETSYVVVLSAPNAGFSESLNGTTVSLTNTSTNASSYSYDFGDGNTSTDENPTHVYSGGGTYTITQTVSNACGTDVATTVVNISSAPLASFIFPGEVCFGAPVTLSSTSTGTVTSLSYEITRPDGTSFSIEEDPYTFTPTQRGSYDVTLVVSNATGQTSSIQSDAIVVLGEAMTNFAFSISGQGVAFTGEVSPVLPGSAVTYAWDFGDGNTSTASSPTHTYQTPGTYTVALTATNGCESDIETQTITIGDVPSVTFTSSVDGPICPGEEVTYTANVNGIANSITWNLPGASNTTPTGEVVVVTYDQSGTYGVSVEVCNALGCNSSTNANEITVRPLASAGFTTTTFGALGIQVVNAATNASSFTYEFGDGNDSTEENPTHTYAGAGTYTITQRVVGPCNTDEASFTVTVGQAPQSSFNSNPAGGAICPGETVSYFSTSAGASSFLWSFPGGTPATSTAQNPQVVYNTSGEYDVTLTVMNALGSDTRTETRYVVVGVEPTAAYSSTTSGLSASFTNESTSATTFAWEFGDGNTSSLANPTHTYASSGSYSVTLEVSNECGTDRFVTLVNVLAAPTAAFSTTEIQGCTPHTVTFDASNSSDASSFLWSFPGGTPSTSTERMPTIVYNEAGTFDVLLTVSNGTGTDSETRTNLISIDSAPTALFTSELNGLVATFLNQSTGDVSYEWDFGDGINAFTESASHTYARSGTYTVNLDVTNACGTTRFSETITVLAAPVASFSQTTSSGCAPLVVTYDASNSTDAASFLWVFPGGNPSTSSEVMPVVTYENPGAFSAELTVTNATGSDTEALAEQIVVAPLALAGFNADVDMLSVNFVNTSMNANTYRWDFGNGMTSNDPNPSVTYAVAGTYTVQLIATNDCGENEITQIVTVAEGLPNAEFSLSVTSGCAPLDVQLTDETTGNPTSWSWSVSSNSGASLTSTEQNPVFTLTEAGLYTFTLEATNDAGSTTEVRSDIITVFAIPTVVTSVGNIDGANVQFEATLTDADTYAWDFGDGNTSTIEDPLHTYEENGTYEVILTATNSCGQAQDTSTVSIMVSGVGELPENARFVLFPNPTSGNVTWSLSGVPAEQITLLVTDILGREMVHERLGAATAFRQNLSLEGFAAGVYLVRLKAESYEHQVRVIKQ